MLELSIVGDGPNAWVEGSDHPAHADCLDVGEV